MLIEGDSPVIEKLNGIHEAGTAALRAGDVQPFTGYPESLKNRFGVYLRYDELSEQLVRQVVLDEVARIGQDLGIGLFIAGRPTPEGHPFHTTVLEGLYEEEDSDKKDLFYVLSKIGLLKTLPGVIFDTDVQGWQLEFDAVLVDKGPVLLAATQIPQQIVDIRGELSQLYSKIGNMSLKPLPLDNLLHMTLTRMTGVVDPARADEYIDRMESLHRNIAEIAPVLTVKTLVRKNAFDMLHGS